MTIDTYNLIAETRKLLKIIEKVKNQKLLYLLFLYTQANGEEGDPSLTLVEFLNDNKLLTALKEEEKKLLSMLEGAVPIEEER
jgi:hypothetical protein